MDLFSLKGRVALITGGNRGLGRAMALGLRDAGSKVAVTGRDPHQNSLIERELGDGGVAFALDVRNEAEVQRTIELVTERFGGLDILINNAGVARGGLVTEMSRETWDEVLETNLTGAFLRIASSHSSAEPVL